MKLYHYTCIEHWSSIWNTGCITLADSNLMVGLEDMESISLAYKLDVLQPVKLSDGTMAVNHVSTLDEPKVVHFTKTAERKPELLKWTQGAAVDKSRVRITVDVPMMDVHLWHTWHDSKGGSQLMKQALANTGGDWKNWYVCEREIPRSEWVEAVDMVTGQVLYRRPDVSAPVTKLDVELAVELAYWVGMEKARIVVLNDRAMDALYSYAASIDHSVVRNVAEAEFEDYFFVFMSPQSLGLKDKENRAIQALGVRFTTEGKDMYGDYVHIVTNTYAALGDQRWSNLATVYSDRCKVAVGGSLMFNMFSHLYLDLRGFLATPCAHSEARKAPSAIKLPGRAQVRTKAVGDISVVVYRKPEKVIRARMKASGRKLDHQVQVSGHLRNQWYPSTKSHKQIFVAAHTKGPEGVQSPRLRVIKAVR